MINPTFISIVIPIKIDEHRKTECEFQEIECPYFEVGCSFKVGFFKRFENYSIKVYLKHCLKN